MRRLSPSFVRVTFTGDDLDRFADNGFDQRIKLILPLPGDERLTCRAARTGTRRWRALPDERRNPVRTYTVRAVRPDLREVDVDIVLHGDGGPASRWARRVRPGDEIAILGPDAGYDGTTAASTSGRRRQVRCCWPATRPPCRRSARSWSACRPTPGAAC